MPMCSTTARSFQLDASESESELYIYKTAVYVFGDLYPCGKPRVQATPHMNAAHLDRTGDCSPSSTESFC